MPCYLVVAQLLARARSGSWLRTDHLVESARIWSNGNGAIPGWFESVRLGGISRHLAESTWAVESLPRRGLAFHRSRTPGDLITDRRSCKGFTMSVPHDSVMELWHLTLGKAGKGIGSQRAAKTRRTGEPRRRDGESDASQLLVARVSEYAISSPRCPVGHAHLAAAFAGGNRRQRPSA